MKIYKDVVIVLILATVLPFFALVAQLDMSLATSAPDAFWLNVWLMAGSITGMIGTILLMWSLILGVRFFTVHISADILWIYKLHKWLGKYGAIFALIHPFLSMYSYGENLLWIITPSLADNHSFRVTLGRIAYLLLITIWITSVLIKDKVKYRNWLYIHYLAYPLVLISIIHAQEIGTALVNNPQLAAFWKSLIFITIIVAILRLIYASGVLSYKYKIRNVNEVSTDLFEISLSPERGIPRNIKEGQYFYLQVRPFGESHPFSLMKSNSETGELVFGIKTLGKFTKKLFDSKIGETIKLDGPYGVFTQDHPTERLKLIIAGGIGITPFVPGILSDPSNTILLNCNSYLENALQRNELRQSLQENYYDFITREEVSGDQIINERVSYENICKILREGDIQNAEIYLCGSKNFLVGLEKDLIKNGLNSEQIHIEEFF